MGRLHTTAIAQAVGHETAGTRKPYDWVNNAVPINFEFEFGKMFTLKVGVFAQVLGGIGADRTLDWGSALAIRWNF